MDENALNSQWLLFMLLAMNGMEQNPNFLNDLQKRLEEDRKRKEQEETIRYHCDAIEYEQDMGKSIPFCRRYGGFCNMQCVQNGNYYQCWDENKEEYGGTED